MHEGKGATAMISKSPECDTLNAMRSLLALEVMNGLPPPA